MKKQTLILILIALLCMAARSQGQIDLHLPQPTKEPQWKPIVGLTLIALGGVADGVNQAINHHYSGFKYRYPNANDSYWNPDISWVNKWKNGDPEQGEVFPGSSSVLVWTTDGYHATRTLDRIFTISGGLLLGSTCDKWWEYALATTISLCLRGIVFHSVHDWYLK